MVKCICNWNIYYVSIKKTSNNVIEIVNGEYKRGQMDKSTLGSGSKGLILSIFNDFNFKESEKSAKFAWNSVKKCVFFMFSIFEWICVRFIIFLRFSEIKIKIYQLWGKIFAGAIEMIVDIMLLYHQLIGFWK